MTEGNVHDTKTIIFVIDRIAKIQIYSDNLKNEKDKRLQFYLFKKIKWDLIKVHEFYKK